VVPDTLPTKVGASFLHRLGAFVEEAQEHYPGAWVSAGFAHAGAGAEGAPEAALNGKSEESFALVGDDVDCAAFATVLSRFEDEYATYVKHARAAWAKSAKRARLAEKAQRGEQLDDEEKVWYKEELAAKKEEALAKLAALEEEEKKLA